LQLWDSVTASYVLSPAELALLTRAARAADRLARIDNELADSALIVAGTNGQPRPNPLIDAANATERVLDILLRSLALPLPDETAGKVRSPSAQMAARQRWGTHG
jgi:hypothetical protein